MAEYDLMKDVDSDSFSSPGTFAEDGLGGEETQAKDTGWVSVTSSMISAVRYVSAEGLMYVRFVNGAEYTYAVPKQVFDGMLGAPSIGSYFRKNVYNRYKYSRS